MAELLKWWEIGEGQFAVLGQREFLDAQALALHKRRPIEIGIKIVVTPPADPEALECVTSFQLTSKVATAKSIEYTEVTEEGKMVNTKIPADAIQTAMNLLPTVSIIQVSK
jgi:hypothetical protein